MTSLPIPKYPYDYSAMATTNLVIQELHTLTPNGQHTIIPQCGPYYSKSMIITSMSLGRDMIQGEDYQCTYLYQDATIATGNAVCIAISITDVGLGGDFLLTYQVVGGPYSTNVVAIAEILETIATQLDEITWNDIKNKPVEFPPTPHAHHVDEISGFGDVVHALDHLSDRIHAYFALDNAPLWAAIDDKVYKYGRTRLLPDGGDMTPGHYIGPLYLRMSTSDLLNNRFGGIIHLLGPTGWGTLDFQFFETTTSIQGFTYHAQTPYHDLVCTCDYTSDKTYIELRIGDASSDWSDTTLSVHSLMTDKPDFIHWQSAIFWSSDQTTGLHEITIGFGDDLLEVGYSDGYRPPQYGNTLTHRHALMIKESTQSSPVRFGAIANPLYRGGHIGKISTSSQDDVLNVIRFDILPDGFAFDLVNDRLWYIEVDFDGNKSYLGPGIQHSDKRGYFFNEDPALYQYFTDHQGQTIGLTLKHAIVDAGVVISDPSQLSDWIVL